MTTPNRSAKLVKTHKVLKKHYDPVPSQVDRSLLEHLLYACCLENAPYEKADEAYAKLQQSYFDWNEIRVTTVAELAEVLAVLPDAQAAAARLKRVLQSVFDAHYSFDLEPLKKQNIGKSVKRIEKYQGATPFIVAYVTQHSLAGHAIAVDEGTLGALLVLGIVSEAEAAKHQVPGMERAVPKSKGVEFGSLLHQLGADFFAGPLSAKVKGILAEIDPESKDRLPKKTAKAEQAKPAPPPTKDAGKPRREEPRKGAAETEVKKKPSAEAPRTKKAESAEPASKKSSSKMLAKKKPR